MKSLPTLQAHGGTIPGRCWTEFSALRDLCVLPHSARILSFGCSSGDELFTIREFFPDASIVGCDVDPARVDIAKRRTSGWATVFVATPSAIRDTGPFDIVVANSVLMDSSRQNGVDAQAWLDIVSLLTEALAAGGLLQIINSNIAFRRHPHAKDFAPLEHPLVLGSNFASQFDLDGRFLAEGVAGLGRSAHLHRHVARDHWRDLAHTDLDHVHFEKLPAPARAPKTKAADALSGPIVADGSSSYHSRPAPDASSLVDVYVEWRATAEHVLIKRLARRKWFNGESVCERQHVTYLEGADASAFLESATARPLTPRFT